MGNAIIALVRGQYVCLMLNADGDLWTATGDFIPRGFYTVAGVVLERVPKD